MSWLAGGSLCLLLLLLLVFAVSFPASSYYYYYKNPDSRDGDNLIYLVPKQYPYTPYYGHR